MPNQGYPYQKQEPPGISGAALSNYFKQSVVAILQQDP